MARRTLGYPYSTLIHTMQLWFYQLTVGLHENIPHVNLIDYHDWNIHIG